MGMGRMLVMIAIVMALLAIASSTIPTDAEVVIVGGGVAGASAAFHLTRAGIQRVVLLERGSFGEGSNEGLPLVPHAKIPNDDDADRVDGVFRWAQSSGSNVLPDPVATIKMIVNLYTISSSDFIAEHGENGARSYLRMAHLGLELQKDLARKMLPAGALQSHGSYYVCKEDDVKAFEEEFRLLVELGADGIEWLGDQERVEALVGVGWARAIFFPHDAVIDSVRYAAALIDWCRKQGTSFEAIERAPSVVNVANSDDGLAVTTLEDGSRIVSKFVVMATGALFNDPALAGIMWPAWSYLVGMTRTPGTQSHLESPNSANLFSWGFTHDWAMCNGYLRISGEDHHSALKAPRSRERCANLAEWADRLYPGQFEADGYATQYGVYGETVDHAPIIGRPGPASRVCYLLGCNAWGQAILSYAASLVPALLEYREMTEEEASLFELFNIRRFAFLPAVMESTAEVTKNKSHL